MSEDPDRNMERAIVDFCQARSKDVRSYAKMIRQAANAPPVPLLMVVALDLDCPHAAALASPMLATLGEGGARAIKKARENKTTPVAIGVVTTSAVLKAMGSTYPVLSGRIMQYQGSDPLVLAATAGGVQVFVHDDA